MSIRSTERRSEVDLRNRKDTLDRAAYQHIKEMILTGRLRPGQPIIQEDLAAELGVSRTPLRRALAELASENLLERGSRGTYYVKEFSPQELVMIWEIRAVLEGLVCRLAAPDIQKADLAYLKALFPAREEYETKDEWEEAYRQADVRFHTHMTGLVDSDILSRTMDSYLVMTITLYQGLLRPPDETLPEHQEILQRLEEHDPQRAEEAARRHIRRSIEVLKTTLRA